MMNTRFLILVVILIPCLFSISACVGDNDDDGFVDSDVVDISFDDNTIRVGEGVVVRIAASFSRDAVFDDGENVVIVVRLPSEVTFREGTAEIQSIIGDDDSVGAQITDCAETGEQYLVFDLDDEDLDWAKDPNGEADAILSLTVDATAQTPRAFVEAKARNNSLFFGCDEEFRADEVEELTII